MSERAVDDRFSIRTPAELLMAVQRSDTQVAESLCRKYVARHPSDLNAWRLLINCVERNDNGREAVRLAEMLLATLPEAVDAVAFAGSVLATHGATDRAYAVLCSKEERLPPSALVTLGQLCLTRNTGNAARLFGRALDREDSLEGRLGLANVRSLAVGKGAPVGFFLLHDWHRSIQQPIQDACLDQRLPTYMTTTAWLFGETRTPLVVASETSMHAAFRALVPGLRIVHTRHGLGDKNFGFAAAAAADFVCVSSEAVADDYVRLGMFEPSRFWVTGYSQLDGLFRKLRSGAYRVEPRTVLFAPTFTKGLSAGLKLGPNAINLIRGSDSSIRVIVRPHPIMRQAAPKLLSEWRIQSLTMDNVEFNDDAETDICDLLLRSAVMITDVSSIALTYLALDRPIVCVNVLRDASASPNFAPDAVEWRMTEAAERVEPSALAKAVQGALADPGQRSADRQRLRRYLFGDLTDGCAGERIARKISEAIRNG